MTDYLVLTDGNHRCEKRQEEPERVTEGVYPKAALTTQGSTMHEYPKKPALLDLPGFKARYSPI